MNILKTFSFPLLNRELSDMAQRQRTYWARLCYFILAAIFFLVVTYRNLIAGANLEGDLNYYLNFAGKGRQLFEDLLWFQYWGTIIFLPAMMSGAVSRDKERGRFSLLILSALSPWSILIEKLASRIIPIITFQMISLPMGALVYALGGFDSSEVWKELSLLFITTLAIGSLSLMYSVYCRGVFTAFVMSYLTTAILIPIFQMKVPQWPELTYLEPIFATLVFLFLGRRFLEPRANLPPYNFGRIFIISIRQFWREWNEIHSHGIILTHDHRGMLPKDNPVAWREYIRKNTHLQSNNARLIIMTTAPIFFLQFGIYVFTQNAYEAQHLSVAMLYCYWWFPCATLGLLAMNLFSYEKDKQTIDLLLTLPFTWSDFVEQKMKALTRVGWIIITPCFVPLIWSFVSFQFQVKNPLLYYIFFPIAIVIYSKLIIWTSCCAGIFIKNRIRALLILLSLALLINLTPFLAFYAQENHFYHSPTGKVVNKVVNYTLTSGTPVPMTFFFDSINQFYKPFQGDPATQMPQTPIDTPISKAIALVIAAILAWFFRYLTYKHGEKWLLR